MRVKFIIELDVKSSYNHLALDEEKTKVIMFEQVKQELKLPANHFNGLKNQEMFALSGALVTAIDVRIE